MGIVIEGEGRADKEIEEEKEKVLRVKVEIIGLGRSLLRSSLTPESMAYNGCMDKSLWINR